MLFFSLLTLLTLLLSFVINGDLPVPPNVSMFKRQGTGQVFCHATGFYPDEMMIIFKKDGVEIQDDIGETLPNEDGTFQKRAVLMQSPEELQQITCEVVDSSGINSLCPFPETSSTPPLHLHMGELFPLSSVFCIETELLNIISQTASHVISSQCIK